MSVETSHILVGVSMVETWGKYMAMAQNYQPPKWMVFLLNMIISVCHWYHNFEPNPYVDHGHPTDSLLVVKSHNPTLTMTWPRIRCHPAKYDSIDFDPCPAITMFESGVIDGHSYKNMSCFSNLQQTNKISGGGRLQSAVRSRKS